MDHTLVDNDCDVSWKHYAVEAGLAPASALEEADRYFGQYNAGTLEVEEFLRFQFREFVGRTPEEMAPHTELHFWKYVRPRSYPAAEKLLSEIVDAGLPTAILSSTNDVIARPVADFFGVGELPGTRLEVVDGRYTGGIVGPYTVGAGKLEPARAWAARHGFTLADAAYYGDSVNDIPLLEAVGFPVAANPAPELESVARARNWPIIDFSA